jgi:serine/threonine protein kinase
VTNNVRRWDGETLPPDGAAGENPTPAPAESPVSRTGEEDVASAPTEADTEGDPTRIADRYRIVERLGVGGYGIVYRAIDERLDKPVAVKVLSRRAVGSMTAVARFRNEALAAGRLAHPGIVAVSDFETLPDGRPYIVMELVHGETLGARLRRLGPMPIRDAVRVMLQVCAALERVHRLGIIHRDLKPANVMLCDADGGEPLVKVVDFGIAKLSERINDESLTQNGQVIGTPAYMAPEQARAGTRIDERADLYAAAIILYEMVSGTLPFSREHAVDALVSKLVDAPRPLGQVVPRLPEGFEAVVMKAMAREPEARVASAGEWAAALRPFSEGAAATTSTSTSSARRGSAVGWAVAALLAAAAAGVGWYALRRPRPESISASGASVPATNVAPQPPAKTPEPPPEKTTPAGPSVRPPQETAPPAPEPRPAKSPRVRRGGAPPADPLDLPDAPVRSVRVHR